MLWGGVGECVPFFPPVTPSFFPALSDQERMIILSCSDFVPHSPLSARLEDATEYSDLRSFKPRFKLEQVVCYR